VLPESLRRKREIAVVIPGDTQLQHAGGVADPYRRSEVVLWDWRLETRDKRHTNTGRDKIFYGGRFIGLTGDAGGDTGLPKVVLHCCPQDIPWLAEDHLFLSHFTQLYACPTG